MRWSERNTILLLLNCSFYEIFGGMREMGSRLTLTRYRISMQEPLEFVMLLKGGIILKHIHSYVCVMYTHIISIFTRHLAES